MRTTSANYWKCPHSETADRCRRCDAADVAAMIAWCFGGCGVTVTAFQANWILGAVCAVGWLAPVLWALRRR